MPPNLRNLARVNRKSPLELAALNEVATQRVSEFCGIETSTCRLLHMQARPEPQTQSLAPTIFQDRTAVSTNTLGAMRPRQVKAAPPDAQAPRWCASTSPTPPSSLAHAA